MQKLAPWSIVLLACTGLCLGIGFFFQPSWMAAAAIGAFVAARMFVQSIRAREVGSDILALISIAATALTGEWLASAIIALMLASGQALEEWAAGRARNQLEALVQRAPRNVHLVAADGSISEHSVSDANIDDRFLTRTGEVVALDGVLETDGLFDESALTGEPMPKLREAGEAVASGVVNVAAPVIMRATTDAQSSTYSALVRLVENVKSHSASGVRLANRWALWFVPVSLAASGLTWLITGQLAPAISVLVAATPCPLILAVPIAIIAGISNAAKHGAIIKDGAALELLAKANVMVVDKTGTLTHGGPQVSNIQVAPAQNKDAVLALAASVEQSSAHVLAKAVVHAARDRNLEMSVADDAQEVLGEGLTAVVNGRSVQVGRLPENLPEWAQLKPALQIAVTIDGKLAGIIDLDDPIRPDAVETVKSLRRMGVRRILLATGDRRPSAELVGNAVGVDEIFAECRPEQKLKLVQAEKADASATVLVVGDGINDAPALAAANVGVAMGVRGATAASETASVVIVEDSIARVADAIEIAQGATRRALQAAGIGMGLSLLAMSFGAFGILGATQNALFQEVIDASAILWALAPSRRLLAKG